MEELFKDTFKQLDKLTIRTMTQNQFIEDVFEIAFGDNAINRDFSFEELVERLQQFSDGSNPILIEDAWNEAEELNTSLRELNDGDLLDCRASLIDRTVTIMKSLEEIGTDE